MGRDLEMSKARNLAGLLGNTGEIKTTSLPDGAGGQSTFIASGVLPNGKAVVLNADGTVSAVGGTDTLQSIPVGSASVANASGSYNLHAAFDPNLANRFVLLYQDYYGVPAKAGKIVAGTISGETITFSGVATFDSDDSQFNYISFDPNTPNSFVIINYDATNTIGQVRAGTLVGDTFAFGPTLTFHEGIAGQTTGQTSHTRVEFDPNEAGKFVLTHHASSSPYGIVQAGTVAASTITLGSVHVIGGNNFANGVSLAFDTHLFGRFAISYHDGLNGQYGTVVVGIRAENEVILSSPFVFKSNATNYGAVAFDPNNADRLLVAYEDVPTAQGEVVAVTLVAGEATSLGASHIFNSTSVYGISLKFNPNTEGEFVSAFTDINNSWYGAIVVGQVVGTTITTGSKILRSSGTTDSSIAFDRNTVGSFIHTYTDVSNGYYATVTLGQLTAVAVTLDATTYLGFASASSTHGEPASIALQGSLSTTQEGLTPGLDYYVQSDGSVGTTPGSPAVAAGKALSDNSLLLNKDNETERVGDIITSSHSTPRDARYLLADGAVLQQVDYPELFGVLGSPVYAPNTLMTQPVAPPPGAASGSAISGDGQYYAIGTGAPPFVTLYKQVDGVFIKLDTVAEPPPGAASACAFDAAGEFLTVTTGAPPYMTNYQRSGDVFTKLPTVTVTPGAAGASCSYSDDGVFLSVTTGAPPFMHTYKQTAGVFDKMIDPASVPGGAVSGGAFSGDGTYHVVLYGPPPYMSLYKINAAGTQYEKLAQPSTVPTGAPSGASFTDDGSYLAISHPAVPYLTMYEKNGDDFNYFNNPIPAPSAAPAGVEFTGSGEFMAVIYGAPPFMDMFRHKGQTFSKIDALLEAPSGAATKFSFSSDGSTVVLASAPPPYMRSYKSSAAFDLAVEFILPKRNALPLYDAVLPAYNYIRVKKFID
jgi:hypothetical protein